MQSCHRPSMEAIVMEYLSEKGYWRTAQAAAQPPDTAFEDLSEKDLQVWVEACIFTSDCMVACDLTRCTWDFDVGSGPLTSLALQDDV